MITEKALADQLSKLVAATVIVLQSEPSNETKEPTTGLGFAELMAHFTRDLSRKMALLAELESAQKLLTDLKMAGYGGPPASPEQKV